MKPLPAISPSLNEEKRNQIFNNFIYEPFYKMAENIFNTFKFSYFDDYPHNIMLGCVTHMTRQLEKYVPNTESKKYPVGRLLLLDTSPPSVNTISFN